MENNWFLQRAELFQQLAKEIPLPKKVEFVIKAPSAGWTDVDILIEGKPESELYLTDVFGDPIKKLIVWLESITDFDSPISSIGLDCEHFDACFYYEKLLTHYIPKMQMGEFDEHFYDTGVFGYFDSYDMKWVTAVCNTPQFVKQLYGEIQKFAQVLLSSDDCLDQWARAVYQPLIRKTDCGDSDEEWYDMLRGFVKEQTRSERVERYLENDGKRYIQIM